MQDPLFAELPDDPLESCLVHPYSIIHTFRVPCKADLGNDALLNVGMIEIRRQTCVYCGIMEFIAPNGMMNEQILRPHREADPCLMRRSHAVLHELMHALLTRNDDRLMYWHMRWCQTQSPDDVFCDAWSRCSDSAVMLRLLGAVDYEGTVFAADHSMATPTVYPDGLLGFFNCPHVYEDDGLSVSVSGPSYKVADVIRRAGMPGEHPIRKMLRGESSMGGCAVVTGTSTIGTVARLYPSTRPMSCGSHP